MTEYKAKITGLQYLAPDVLEARAELVAPEEVVFKAGQFMQFRIGGKTRSYSIASTPKDGRSLVFCIGLKPGGLGSEYIKNLKAGDVVFMRGPLGVFTLKPGGRDVFFVATGVGVAPFASIIADALEGGFSGRITLLFGVRNEASLFYSDKFETLAARYGNFEFIPILSQPSADWQGQAGRVTSFLETHLLSYRNRQFFICGGMDVIRDVRQALLARGVDPMDIKLEIFS